MIKEAGIDTYPLKGSTGSFGLIGLVESFGVAHSIAKHYQVDGVSAGIVSLSCFMVVTPLMMNCGATIGLVIALIWYAKKKRSSERLRTLAPITLISSLFSVNEPVTFGVPVVLNVLLLIPFILAPLLNLFISYVAMASGLVLLTRVVPGWTPPPIINGYLTTGSINAVFLQIILLVLDILLYLPIVRSLEMRFKREEEVSDTEEERTSSLVIG